MRSRIRLLHWLSPVVALLGCGDGAPSDGLGSGAGAAGNPISSGTSGVAAAAGHSGSSPPAVGTAGQGGVVAPAGGAGGALGTIAGSAASAGASGDAAAGGAGDAPGGSGAGAGGAPAMDYPPLDAAQIGAPVMVADGFDLAESPLWDPCEHKLLFTDVTASVINALDAGGQVSTFAMNTSNANGIAFDVDGSLILAQMGGSPGSISRRDRAGTLTKVTPAGADLHTPDDVIVRSDGTIYFSDGDFYPIGTLLGAFNQLPVYAIKPGSSMLHDGGDVGGPNGIELSPDESILYVSAYGDGQIVEFGVAADGALTKGEVRIRGLSNPDSLCLDAAGNLYIGVSSGLHIARPDGERVTAISIPSSRGTTSCGFGGDDGRTLYITTWTTLYKIEAMPIPGQDWLVNQSRFDCGG